MTKTNSRSRFSFTFINDSIVSSRNFIDSNETFIEDVNLTLSDLSCSNNLSLTVNPEEFFISDVFSKLQQSFGFLGICDLLFNREENNDISCFYIIDRNLTQDLSKYLEYDSNHLPIPEDTDKSSRLIRAETKSRSRNFSAYNFFKDNVGKHNLSQIYSKKIQIISFNKRVAIRRKFQIDIYLNIIKKEKLKLMNACGLLIVFSLIGFISGGGLGFLIGQFFSDKDIFVTANIPESIGIGGCIGFLIGVLNSRACFEIFKFRYVLLEKSNLIEDCEATAFREFIKTNDSEDDRDFIASL